MHTILPLSKNKRRILKLLHKAKNRQKYGKFLVEGTKIVLELLQNGELAPSGIITTEEWLERNESVVEYASCPIYVTEQKAIDEIASLVNPGPVLLEVDLPTDTGIELQQNSWYLYLADIQDPGNAGTMVRAAEWFGCRGVIFSKKSVDLYNQKTIRACMGSFARIPTMEMNIDEIIKLVPEMILYCAAMEGQNLYQLKDPEPGMLVVGNEGQGLPAEFDSLNTFDITIPAAPTNKADSLNAAMAGAICLAFLTKAENMMVE